MRRRCLTMLERRSRLGWRDSLNTSAQALASFYCGEIRKGAWILIGTILANVLLFAAIMGLAVLPRDVYNGFLSLDGRLLGNIITALFFIAFGGNIIWLIARIIWVSEHRCGA